ncbi:hypothetical protein F4780DRAFT_635959 [Xylariomycetidae sp. FL0641]|nr:hypothetical protein F4780DRAFT_635959 [Xylariomycetidae sp. FL0641]
MSSWVSALCWRPLSAIVAEGGRLPFGFIGTLEREKHPGDTLLASRLVKGEWSKLLQRSQGLEDEYCQLVAFVAKELEFSIPSPANALSCWEQRHN